MLLLHSGILEVTVEFPVDYSCFTLHLVQGAEILRSAC